MRINRMLQVIALAGAAVTLTAATAKADGDSFNVTVNTSALSGTQTIVFGITDGDGVADNNLALSGFAFGGGSAEGLANYIGTGISGDLSSPIDLDDSGFSALFYQQFDPGSLLSFSLDTTNIYAEIDLQMKAKAMALCDAGDPNPSRPWKEDKGVVAFLNSI